MAAKDLGAGDSLTVFSGIKVRLDSVYKFKTDTATVVYNLESSGNHNYYVSASKVLVHNCNSSIEYSVHALKRMTKRGITKGMVEKTIEKGIKYWDPKNKSYAFVLENGFASGQTLIVAKDVIKNKIITVYKETSIPKRFIRVK